MRDELMSRMRTAEKLNLSIPQLQEAIKNGTLPAFVGIPMLKEKMNQKQAFASAQQKIQPPQPSIAEQVMAQAQAEESQGIPQLASNLPMQTLADGGIVAFAEGGAYEDLSEEDYDDLSQEDYEDSLDLAKYNQAMDDGSMSGAIMASADTQKAPYSSVTDAIPESVTSALRGLSEKFAAPVADSPVSKEFAKNKHKYYDKIVSEAERLSLSPDFALRIAQKETGNLANPETAVSSAGAQGVMQLMPRTARGLGVKDPLNPDENISGGVRYAKQMMDKYGDEKLAAMAYNYGPGNLDKWLKSGQGISALPRETQKYAMGFAEGGQVAHFNLGGLGSTGGVPITSEFMNEAQTLGKEARLRLMQEQARAAFAANPKASAAAKSLTPKAGIGTLLGAGAVPAAVALGGAGATTLAGGVLGGMSPEQRASFYSDPMTGAMSGDTGLAAAIQNSPDMDPSTSSYGDQMGSLGSYLGKTIVSAPGDKDSPKGYGFSRLFSNDQPVVKPFKGVPIASPSRAQLAQASEAISTKREQAAAKEKEINPKEEVATPQAVAQAPAAPAKEEPDDYGEYLKMLRGGYEDVKKSKAEDKYLALLAAGLGMMGGTSPHAAANIGAGAMQGISYLADANKQRMAEKAAIDKSLGQGLYYQGRQKDLVTSRADLLKEQIRAHDLTADAARTRAQEAAKQNAEKNFEFALKSLGAAYDKNINNTGKPDSNRDAFLYSHPLIIAKAKAAGIDLSGLGQIDKYPGFSLKTSK